MKVMWLVASTWQIQVLHFETFWNFFFPKYFHFKVGWIWGCKNLWIWRTNCILGFKYSKSPTWVSSILRACSYVQFVHKFNRVNCVVVQSPSLVQLFETPWNAARLASLSFTISWSLPEFMSIASVTPSSPGILWALFSFCLQSFPASGTFPMSSWFISDDQNTGASTSVLPMSIQGWYPLRLTGLISWLSRVLSGVFSSTTVWRHQFFGTLPSLWSSSHNCMWPLGRQ